MSKLRQGQRDNISFVIGFIIGLLVLVLVLLALHSNIGS